MTHAAQVMTHTRRPAVLAGDPILASKITAPGVPDWAVQRPRITKLIAEGVRWCPLTLVTGPPGAGKTMAVALWAAAGPGRIAWVGLDEYDNRPGAFWTYILAALSRCGVAVPKAWPAAAQGRAAGHGFLLRLAAALAAQDPPVTLVLDDLHLLTDHGALEGLAYVLRNVGPGLRLVICSRMDPLLPLHRYRVAGQLTEIRAADLAFSTAEAALLLAQHDCTLSEDALKSLTRRTEGWAAGLRLAALSLGAHPDPAAFIAELAAEESALTGYLVQEVLNTEPPEVREVLLCTSILEQVSADVAAELTGQKEAAAIWSASARANTFIQPTGAGWHRYHTLFAEVLRLKLRHEQPDRVVVLHRRAARWHERNGLLPAAVRHAAWAADWLLAASLVIDNLAISDILEPAAGRSLAAEFAGMPPGQPWAEPEPHLISAAVALSAGADETGAAALNAAEGILEQLPAEQKATCRLAGAMIRFTLAYRTGDLAVATEAAARAEVLLGKVPDRELARRPDLRARVLSGRGAAELWSGRLDQAARVLESGLAAEAASGRQDQPPDCLGNLALVEALRGQLRRSAQLAGRVAAALTASQGQLPARNQDPAALVALAWVHLDHQELVQARGCLQQADAALAVTGDKLTGTLAHLTAGWCALAGGRSEAATQIIARARAGWPVPAWLDQQLSLVLSRAFAGAGDIPAALAAAQQADDDCSPEAAVALAHARAAAGDADDAQRVLASALAAGSGASDRVRVQAWLIDARISYRNGDGVQARQSLARALRLATPEQLRLPFAMERGWILPVLRHYPGLSGIHRHLLAPILRPDQLPPPASAPEPAPILVFEPLSERETQVLRHVSGMLSTAEVASEMYLSVNTVKTHLRNIYRKLAVTHRREAVRRARTLQLI